jgi:hypothetical protein
LRYNEKIFKKGLESEVNDNQIFSHNYKEHSSIISNKDLFDKIDRSVFNEQELKETKENLITEDRRKPFKPFLFDKI